MKKFFFKFNFFLIILSIFLINTSFINCDSIEPEEILQNQKHEFRAREISKKIRCMICQNQSIDESSASLAKDLRLLIREKIKEGHTDQEIYMYLTDRYGDFILLEPPFKLSTLALWILPFVFLITGFFILVGHNKKSKKIVKDI